MARVPGVVRRAGHVPASHRAPDTERAAMDLYRAVPILPADDLAVAKGDGGARALATEPFDAPWGARVFRVRDPDGFRWAISSARSPG